MLQLPRSNHGDDRSVISSNLSVNESKPNLNAIGNLLSSDNGGVDWLHTDIITTKPVSEQKTENTVHSQSESKQSSDIKIDTVTAAATSDEMEDVPLIYHVDYQDLISV